MTFPYKFLRNEQRESEPPPQKKKKIQKKNTPKQRLFNSLKKNCKTVSLIQRVITFDKGQRHKEKLLILCSQLKNKNNPLQVFLLPQVRSTFRGSNVFPKYQFHGSRVTKKVFQHNISSSAIDQFEISAYPNIFPSIGSQFMMTPRLIKSQWEPTGVNQYHVR